MSRAAVFLCFCLAQSILGKIYIVDNKVEVTGKRFGSIRRPFKTIEGCIEKLKNKGNPCLSYLNVKR